MRLLVSRHLENFMALYSARNMHAAADAKGISQPALTKSLKLLEADLGVELFARTSKGIEATPAGHRLYRYASAIEQQARLAAMDFPEFAERLGGRIRIGVGPVLAASVFPAIVVAFHNRFRTINVAVETGISSSLAEGLINNDHDLIVAARPDEPLGSEFQSQALFGSEMIVICRKDHPLRSSGAVTIGDLVRYERVGFIEDREFEKKSRRALGAHSESMQPHIETASMAVMFGILASTDYYAIASDILLPRAEQDGLSRLNIGQDLWRIEVEMMCRRSLAKSRPIMVMRDLLLSRVNG